MYAKNKKIVFSGLCIALYIIIMLCTQSFAFGQYQIRIATVMYGLSALFPFLIIPLGIANIISNTIMGGMGIPDIIGGGIVGLIATSVIVLGKRHGFGNWIIWVSVTFVPGLIVPIWLSFILNLPYILLVSTILVGQCICGFISMMLVTALEKIGLEKSFAIDGGNNK